MTVTKYTLVLILLASLPFQFARAQEEDEKERNFRIEIEPSSFFLRGVSASVQYAITKDRHLSLGPYLATVDIPVFPRKRMFDNVGADTTSARLGFQIALMARYRINLFKEMESNPYVGLIAGWEYFDIKQPYSPETVRLTTYVLTPYLGYELYYFRKMLYVNPQIRSVFYLGQGTDHPERPERVSSFFLLPQISLGIRL
ncbi:MAG: hypothetical protein WDZ35_09895 [Crocinitomicaceae bacterium]